MSNLSKIFSKTIQMGSEEDFDQICDFCIKQQKRMEAIIYCVECEEYLCHKCRKNHKKTSATKQHNLLDMATMSTSQKSRKRLPGASGAADPLTDRCQKHPDEFIKFFCSLHQQLGCSVCVSLHHRNCGDRVDYIRNIATEITRSTEFNKVCFDVMELLGGLKSSKSRSKECQQEVVNSYDQAVAEMKTLRRDINQLFDKLEESLPNDASRQRKTYLDSLTHQEQRFDDLIKEVNEMSSDLDRKCELKNYSQLFIAMKYAKANISVLEKEATHINQTIKPQRFVFNHDGKLDLLTSSIARLGTLSLVGQPETASYLQDIVVSAMNKICYISGAVVLANGQLVVTDHDNKCIKIVNTEKIKVFQEEVSFKSSPADITLIGDNQLAVTFPANNQIQFMSLSPTLSVRRTITGPWSYRGITYSRGNLFLTSLDHVPSVHICDMSGNLLRQIDSDNAGNKLFEKPSGITTSPDGRLIYVSDFQSNKIVCLSRDGPVMASYKHDKLQMPRGITVDDEGHVYICSYQNGCILQLSLSGQLRIVVTEEKNLEPLAIAYSTGKLYVSSSYCLRDKIFVYKLE